jgi:hypothetical protein
MSEEDLQLLITLDDPVDEPEVDTFHEFQSREVTFGQGDWTCTVSKVAGTTNSEVCTVTHWKNGEILEQKVFYGLSGIGGSH